MKSPEQIINEIRNFILNSKPFRFAGPETTVLNLLIELENTLSPSESITEETVVEEVVVEEPIIEEVVEVTEETVVEETPIVEEPVVAKKSTKKK